MDTKTLIAYSLSSIGVIALVHQILKYFRHKTLLQNYFQNKIVLITGASSGLGAALAEELYPFGAQLILCARRLDELNNVKEKLMKLKLSNTREPEVACLDVTSSVQIIKQKLDQLITKYGCIDILINNAGITFRGEAALASEEVFQKLMDVNFFGVVKITNLIVKHMIDENKKPRETYYKSDFSIVNVGSVQTLVSPPFRSAYAASKHALLAYSDALRAELYAHNINIINTFPGYINTNISLNALRDTGAVNNQKGNDHLNGYSPNYVAKVTIDAIMNRDPDVFISIFIHRLAVWIRFFSPKLFHFIMKKRAKKTVETNSIYL